MGQRATIFWHEASHSRRILSRPRWVRWINRAVINRSGLGRAIEEYWAMSDALGRGYKGRRLFSLSYAMTYRE